MLPGRTDARGLDLELRLGLVLDGNRPDVGCRHSAGPHRAGFIGQSYIRRVRQQKLYGNHAEDNRSYLLKYYIGLCHG